MKSPRTLQIGETAAPPGLINRTRTHGRRLTAELLRKHKDFARSVSSAVSAALGESRCALCDIPNGGGRLAVARPLMSLPPRFLLQLDKDGRVQRKCEIAAEDRWGLPVLSLVIATNRPWLHSRDLLLTFASRGELP
jgi:hypothetical protein